MSIKSIFVPLEESELLASVLTCALLVSKKFGSYIEGAHIRPLPAEVLTVAGEGLYASATGLLQALEQYDNERAQRTRKKFERFMEKGGVQLSVTKESYDIPRAVWLEEAKLGDAAVGSRGRVFDLTVVGRQVKKSPIPSRNRLESAIFDSGRLTLVAPPQQPIALGDTIVIAWNGSTETARTIGLALPFLQKAKQVIILEIDGYGVTGPTGTEVKQYLSRNGVEGNLVLGTQENNSVAQAINKVAISMGADLLIKGAYTHSRLSQMIFGGVTSEILSTTEIPVLISH